MLNAAILIERADIELGGAERSVSELTAELRQQGVAATILAAKGTAGENTQILCGDYAGKRVPLKVFEKAVQEHLERNTYDIIHSTLPLSQLPIFISLAAAAIVRQCFKILRLTPVHVSVV